mgnify:CR=1 FL=1
MENFGLMKLFRDGCLILYINNYQIPVPASLVMHRKKEPSFQAALLLVFRQAFPLPVFSFSAKHA